MKYRYSLAASILGVGLMLAASAPAPMAASNCANTSIAGLSPSTYVRSQAHTNMGLLATASITPRDAAGLPSTASTARIGGLMLGMSSANEIHSALLARYSNYSNRNPYVKMVNASANGQTATEWANPNSSAWGNVDSKLAKASLTHAQVQFVHIILTQKYPLDNGAMTEAQVRAIVDNITNRFTNVQAVYFSGHTYTGYANDPTLTYTDWGRAPEPFVNADSHLLASLAMAQNFPVFVTFNDLWSNGTTPNPITGFSWPCSYVKVDGVHPNTDGKRAAALLLLESMWYNDPVLSWLHQQ